MVTGAGTQLLGRIIKYIIDPIILLIFSVGFLVFLWGLYEYMRHVEEGAEHTEGPNHMLYGVIGMFIMIAVGGLISLIDDTFGLNLRNQTFDINGAAQSTGLDSAFPSDNTGVGSF